MSLYTKAVSILARGIGLMDPRLLHFVGATGSSSGERVSVHTALMLDAVWACVRLIAQTLATLPLQLFKNDGEGRGTIQRDHPLYALLHDRPNAEMTAVTFWEGMVAAILLWGNAYAEITRVGGRIVALTPMMPDRLTVRRQPDGSLLYNYNLPYGGPVKLTEDQVLHIKGFSLDGLVGISPITQARETLGIAIAAERSTGSLFKNGMRPSAVLVAPTYLTEGQRKTFGPDFVDKYMGSMNAGRVPLLEGGWELKQIGISPADAQLLATRQFSVEQICRWYGVAPVMIGHMEKSTAWGTGLEQMNLWFLTYTLTPLLKSIEQTIAMHLFTPLERRELYVEFKVDALLRADSAGRAAMIAILADHGLRTRNELRALDNMPPLDGGDELTVMSTLTPIQKLGEAPPTAAAVPPAASGNVVPLKPAERKPANASI